MKLPNGKDLGITHKELATTAGLLNFAATELASRGCDDLPDNFFDGWTDAEKVKLVMEFHQWNGDPENAIASGPYTIRASGLLDFFAGKIKWLAHQITAHDETHISQLGLSPTLYRGLRVKGVINIGLIKELSKHDFFRIQGLAGRSYKELVRVMDANGIAWPTKE